MFVAFFGPETFSDLLSVAEPTLVGKG